MTIALPDLPPRIARLPKDSVEAVDELVRLKFAALKLVPAE